MKKTTKNKILILLIIAICFNKQVLSVTNENLNAIISKESINSYSDSLIIDDTTPQKRDKSIRLIPITEQNQDILPEQTQSAKSPNIQNDEITDSPDNRIYNITLDRHKNKPIENKTITASSNNNIVSAKKKMQYRDYNAVAKQLDNAIFKDSNLNEWQYAQMAEIYEKTNNIHKAIFAYEKAISVNPSRIEILYNYSQCLCRANHYNKAIYNLKRITRIKPDFMLAYYKIASIYHANGDYINALRYYNKSIKINPLSSDTYYNVAITLEDMQNQKLAKLFYIKCLKINPDDEQAAEAVLRLNNA